MLTKSRKATRTELYETAWDRKAPPRIHLTPRQREVLALLCQGLSNKVICRRLDISTGTVKVHVAVILKELGVSSRVQAVLTAHRLGLADEDFEEQEDADLELSVTERVPQGGGLTGHNDPSASETIRCAGYDERILGAASPGESSDRARMLGTRMTATKRSNPRRGSAGRFSDALLLSTWWRLSTS